MSVRATFKRDALFKALRSTVPGIEKGLTEVNQAVATEIVASAKRLAPRDDGTLSNSIRMSKGERPTQFVVEAGGPTTTKPVRAGLDASYDYALGIEFGTVDTSPQPFFWPSVRVNKKVQKRRAAKAMRDAIKKAGFHG